MKFSDYFNYIENGLSCLVRKNGKEVGYTDCYNGFYYWRTMHLGKSLRVHRIIYEMFNGKIPDGYVINHINSDSLDNKISNLECVTPAENNRRAIMHTKSIPKSNNTSGENGVVMQTCSGILYASARWYDLDGVQHSKSFNVDKLGKEIAVKLAKEYRENKLSEIHSESFDYKDLNFRNERNTNV